LLFVHWCERSGVVGERVGGWMGGCGGGVVCALECLVHCVRVRILALCSTECITSRRMPRADVDVAVFFPRLFFARGTALTL
jgi:hypothetical protein